MDLDSRHYYSRYSSFYLTWSNIYPIFGENRTIIGQGFVADGLFITAAHILKVYVAPYILVNGRTYALSKEPPLFVSFFEDSNVPEDSYDLAVYNFKGVESPLTLSSYLPQIGDVLSSHCMVEVAEGTSIFADRRIILDTTPAYPIGAVQGNYFVCECVRHEGSSGSPLLNNNDVVGIMHGGYGNDECVFLSASAIIKALKEHHQFSK